MKRKRNTNVDWNHGMICEVTIKLLTEGLSVKLFPLPARKEVFVDQMVISLMRSTYAIREAARRKETNYFLSPQDEQLKTISSAISLHI